MPMLTGFFLSLDPVGVDPSTDTREGVFHALPGFVLLPGVRGVLGVLVDAFMFILP